MQIVKILIFSLKLEFKVFSIYELFTHTLIKIRGRSTCTAENSITV